ncbi:hypothetical protein GCM10020229_71570 [Kitasatospora albolonga]
MGQACGRSASAVCASGVPSAVTGSTVQAVKSVAMPITGGRVDAAGGERGGDRGAQHLAPVLGVLERPVGRQLLAGAGESVLDHAVRVLVDAGAELLAVTDPHHHGARPERVPKSTPTT